VLKDASRRKFDVAMTSAIDRLGRSLIDLLRTSELMADGNGAAFDTAVRFRLPRALRAGNLAKELRHGMTSTYVAK
jgi:hypothetical protein